ncbi:MAG TPA: class I SAM-dependent methyltransferase [Ktedonobacterales bacterium]|jgi:SAM-dependent methyltransferase
MTAESTQQVDWTHWIVRWDAMQTAYLPFREERFSIMLDVVAEIIGDQFVALDLACGPGAISQRLLARFPQAQSIAVDYDPALLALGRGALGNMEGRLRWVEADLRDPNWITQLGETQVDAVLSTTALHWLDAGPLTRLYGQLGALVRPGGIVLNGDHMSYPPHLPTFRKLAEAYVTRRRAQVFGEQNGSAQEEDWRAWWAAFAREPGVESLVVERERRFASVSETRHGTNGLAEPTKDGSEPSTLTDTTEKATQFVERESPIAEVHEAALRDAGFQEVGVIWRNLDDGILLAVR